jgi:hypothetical protein
MKNVFNVALIVQFICAMLFIDHRFYQPLDSGKMFWVLIVSVCMSAYMFWQISTSKILVKSHKVVGTIFASLSLIWLLLLFNFIA